MAAVAWTHCPLRHKTTQQAGVLTPGQCRSDSRLCDLTIATTASSRSPPSITRAWQMPARVRTCDCQLTRPIAAGLLRPIGRAAIFQIPKLAHRTPAAVSSRCPASHVSRRGGRGGCTYWGAQLDVWPSGCRTSEIEMVLPLGPPGIDLRARAAPHKVETARQAPKWQINTRHIQ